jgi:hypothetical protein
MGQGAVDHLGVRASCSVGTKRLNCVLKGRAGGRSQNDWAEYCKYQYPKGVWIRSGMAKNSPRILARHLKVALVREKDNNQNNDKTSIPAFSAIFCRRIVYGRV